VWQPVSELPLDYAQELARSNYYQEMNENALTTRNLGASTAAILTLL
jgi:hypothetical protein